MLMLAFPPFNFTFLVFVALAPWWASLRDTDGRGAWRSGYTFGLLFWLFQLFWLVPFVSRWTGSVLFGVVPWLLGPPLGALYFGLVAVLIRHCWKLQVPWAIPIIWAGVELIRSYFPVFAFPWGLIASPLWQYPYLIQLANIGTYYLVAVWVCWMNLIVTSFLLNRPLKELSRDCLLFLALLAGSLVKYATPTEGKKSVISIGQTGIDMAFDDPKAAEEKIASTVQSFMARSKGQGSGLLVLPEGLVNGGSTLPPQTKFIVPTDSVPLLFGGERGEKTRYQSAYAYDGKWSYADKSRLVIFGEFVPFRSVLPFLSAFNLPAGDLTAGESVKALSVGGIKVGPVICFEGLFYDIASKQSANGAQLLAVISIDDWYQNSNAPEQLAGAAIWRAVETGLPIVRAASLGISLAADQRGNLLTRLPQGQSICARVELNIDDKPTKNPIQPIFVWLLGLSVPVLWGCAIFKNKVAAKNQDLSGD